MEKRIQNVKKPEESVKTMGFNEFLAFIGKDYMVPEGQVLVPMYSLSFPYYTVWFFAIELVDRMRRGG